MKCDIHIWNTTEDNSTCWKCNELKYKDRLKEKPKKKSKKIQQTFVLLDFFSYICIMLSIKEYIAEGITINKTNDGYRVFTIPTQHFNIKNLDELTPERFELEIINQKKQEEFQTELFVEYFKDLF